ncbi:hypothetical protein [Erysipelothrix tonsillarum]|uniref:hypothetical protein n=1 Tax=Erysipelothrix tonsillarum TaxID=38402 RepID=UPI00036FA078|nr:hypothetical protein [Erysipelothrix tonsillarum]
MEQREVYIVLSDTGSLLTRIIKMVTGAPYNHVSISFDASLHKLYSFGRKQPHNPFWGGFVEESFYEGTFKRFKNTRCLVLKLQVEADTYALLEANVRVFIENMDLYHYNFVGLIGAAFKRRIARENGYYCSEFVAEVMEQSNLVFWETPNYLVHPYDFSKVDQFEVVYEGLLADFSKA